MIRKTVLLLLVLLLCAAGGAGAVAVEKPLDNGASSGSALNYTGIWEGRCMLSKVEAHMVHEGDTVRGVAYVHGPDGAVNPYHFNGEIRDGVVTASHFRGHLFTGEFTGPDTVSGTVKTAKKGYVLQLSAQRVSLTPDFE